MNSFRLALFVSLNPLPPCFVIPVFTMQGSNDTFAQDLMHAGSIKRFLRINIDDFAPVQAIAPAVDLQCGQSGLFAFWLDEHVVLCGTRTQLKDALTDAELAVDAPFTEVERAIFLNDKSLIEEKAAEAATLLHSRSARESYVIRVKKRAKLLKVLHDEENRPDEIENFELNSLIELLERENDHGTWLQYWRDGWTQFHGHRRLVDIAKWRIMTKGLGQDEYDILSSIRYYASDSFDEISNWWLAKRPVDQTGWILIWSQKPENANRFSENIVIPALKIAFSRPELYHRWSLLNAWNRCFSIFRNYRDDIVSIAQNNNGVNFYTEHFVQRIASTVLEAYPENEWASGKMSSWFLKGGGSSAWIRLFMQTGQKILSKREFQEVAVRWLRKYGRGTNKWRDLYQSISQNLSKQEAWDLRVSWLMRARKDLYIWPEVFESLVADSGPEDVLQLSNIARMWTFRGRDKRHNRTVEMYAQKLI